MGENQAYPLWLYPRIHVHPRDPTGSLRTSSDWTIKQTTWSPIGDISVPMISHHQTPICQRPSPLGETQPPVLSLLSVWFIFGYISRSLSSPLFYPITHSPFTPVSSFHSRCVPHSFIHSLTHPLMSAYSFLSRTHMPLFFDDSFVHTTHFDSDLLTNRSHTLYSLCFSYLFLSGQMFPETGEQ